MQALVYLMPPPWDAAAFGGPTRFLDPPTGAVFEVAPAPGRVVLLDQVSHGMAARMDLVS